jgi:OOP family OmpA-OmpF porin
MSMVRTALPLVLATSVLSGCAGLQKSDWPTCAAVGGVTGAALAAIKTGAWIGPGALVGGAVAGGWCYAHGDGDDDGDGVLNSRDKCPNTPKGVQVDADGCPPPPPPAPMAEAPAPMPAPLPKEETIVIRDVHFEFDSARLTTTDKAELDKIATRLKSEASTARLSVTGHTDSVGSDSYNQRLSDKRAHSVTDYLVSMGVPRGEFVAVKGVGEAKPVADNKSASGRAQNRRTEILIQR